MPKKIYIDKNDSVAGVIEKILAVGEPEIVLYIPRFSKLSTSPNNFRLLKREIESSGKTVEIETVDDEALDAAKAAGLKASNPFFKKNKRPVSDILLPNQASVDEIKIFDRKKDEAAKPEEVELEEQESFEHDEKKNGKKTGIIHKLTRIKRTKFRVDETPEGEVPSEEPRRGINLIKSAVLISLLAGIFYLAFYVFPSAKIKVVREKNNWEFNGSLLASTLVKEPYFANSQLRVGGIILEKDKNNTYSYPATGSENVSNKASGKITVFNAYSSEPQPIVKDTRFVSPDGKIFRIAQGVTIPGAKIINNKIAPSKIELTVYADKPGPDYNIAATKFRIPGFQGSPKYDGFYAESYAAMTGGYVGIMKVATEQDITKAKELSRKSIESLLRSDIVLGTPQEIKILPGASKFTVTKEEIVKTADSAGNFKITEFANLKVFGFRESDLMNVLKSRAEEEIGTLKGDDALRLELKYGVPIYAESKIDFDKKEFQTGLKFNGTWVREFDSAKFKSAVLGRKGKDIIGIGKDYPGIDSISVSLWPFWVMSIPSNPEKVAIDVE